jgi:hypothetical protein
MQAFFGTAQSAPHASRRIHVRTRVSMTGGVKPPPSQAPESGTDFRFDNKILMLIRSTQIGKTSGAQKNI